MASTPFNNRSSEVAGDLRRWLLQNAGDNSERLERLRRNLRTARETELTPRQRQMLQLYYDQELSMPAIARELGVSVSCVSRTIRRALERLERCLRYGL
jgi:RNA polymerase sigma-70 factor (ECF subfamily)